MSYFRACTTINQTFPPHDRAVFPFTGEKRRANPRLIVRLSILSGLFLFNFKIGI